MKKIPSISRAVESFLAGSGHCDSAGRTDANEAALFGRQLEVVLAASYDVLYYQSKARTLIPFNTSVGNGVSVVTYNQFDFVTDAAYIDDYAKDFPSVQISGKQFSTHFHGIGNSYGYSIQDWRNSQQAGLPLDEKKSRAAREGIERKIETAAAFGDGKHNMTGFANNSTVTIVGPASTGFTNTVMLPGGGGTTATAAQCVADLNLLFKTVFDQTKTLLVADTIVFPTKLFSYLNSTMYSTNGFSAKTIMQVFKESCPWVKHIDFWSRLDTAGADSKGRIIVYARDNRVAEFMLSQDFETFPPTVQGMQMTITCHARIGGCQVRYPGAMVYADGFGGSLS